MRRIDKSRVIRAPHGTMLNARSWLTEAPLRMLMNNLDPDVAERPEELVVYGGIGRAARDWDAYDRIVATLKRLEADETLLIQSGKPVGVFRRMWMRRACCSPTPTWCRTGPPGSTSSELDRKGLMMYGQMTAGSWIYIGSQGIVQGTYETFVEMGRRTTAAISRARWILTAGLGGMGGAQPLAATMAGASCLAIECRQSSIDFRLRTALRRCRARRISTKRSRSSKKLEEDRQGHLGRAARQRRGSAAGTAQARRASRCGHRPDLRARSGQRLPAARLDRRGMGRAGAPAIPTPSPKPRRHSMAVHVQAMLEFHKLGIPTFDYGNNIRQVAFDQRREGRLRFPGLRAGLHPPAVLPRRRTVPLGGAVGRSGRHLQDRCQGEGADSRRQAPAQLARHGARAHQLSRACPRASAGWVSATAIVSASRSTRWLRSGELKAPVVIGRDHLDSGSVASPESRNRSDAGRLRCRLRLAVAQRAAEHRVGRDLGVAASRRRRGHGLLAALRRGHRLRRHRRKRRRASGACSGTIRAPA